MTRQSKSGQSIRHGPHLVGLMLGLCQQLREDCQEDGCGACCHSAIIILVMVKSTRSQKARLSIYLWIFISILVTSPEYK